MSPLDSEAPASETAPAPPQPLVFVETNDAGEQPDGAFSIATDLIQPLAYISGSLAGDADLFQIFISGEQPFSATTLSAETLLGLPIDNALGIPTSLLEDPQLFLFDAAGNGIYGNDDLFGSAQATLPSRSDPLTPGIYFLAISGFDYDPIGAAGEIFPDTSSDGVLLPTGPGASSPLIGFAGEAAPSGAYTIALTGAQTVAPPLAVFDLLGLTDDNQLVSFSTDDLTQTTPLSVTGIEGTLIGIDVRPANGLLYGLTTTNQLYTLALKGDVAEATLVSTLSQPFEGGAVAGFDFNPVADRLRLVGENDQSFRINVDTGAVIVDGTLAFGPGDVNTGANPRVTGAAYTNSFAGTTATQLFDLDAELDALVLQNPPNDGTLQTVGGLGFDLGSLGGFEIVAASAGDNTAFVVSDATLYALDLASGVATSLGAIGTDDTISFQGLTAAPPEPAVEPLPELFDLTGFDGNVAVNVIQQLFREAFFDNVLAFYETDAVGQVAGLLPGDAGYEAAVAANLIDGIELMVGNNQSIDVTLNLPGGTYYAPALLIDGSLQNLATVGDAALGQTRIKREGNTWLFEDAGDFDFNDLIVTLTPEVSAIA